ncbi:MAG: CoA pyrophosphatase [Bacteroidetes bacterium]|nr:CoA pyrophosphatase [Bacteroidota bacterium]
MKRPLPGELSQRKMAPLHNNSRFNHKLREGARKGSVLILLYPNADEIHFPLIQRSEYAGAHGGQIALPGGKYESEDKDLFDTALRETGEEIGVSSGKITLIGALTDLYIPVSNFLISPVVGYATEKPEFVPDSIEVVEVVETSVKQLLNPSNILEKTIHLPQKVKIRAPYFNLSNKTVWGATAMILSEFIETVRDL